MIKICGLTSPYEAGYLNEYNVDFGGMVLFFPKSKRSIDIKRAKEIMTALSESIKSVAVTVSPTVEQLREIEAAGFDILQVHGDLSDDVISSANIPIWRAFNENTDLDRYNGIGKITGYVFDAAEPGSGKTFDWSKIKDIKTDGKMIILAGGLTPENVGAAIEYTSPDAVDVSSGVENDSGFGKDKRKIELFVKNASAAFGGN